MEVDYFGCIDLIHVGRCSVLSDIALAQSSNQKVLCLVEQHVQECSGSLVLKGAVDTNHQYIWEITSTISYRLCHPRSEWLLSFLTV